MTHSLQQQQKKQNLTSFHSKPPVTLNGGHQRRLAPCLRTCRPSGWTLLEIPNRWNVSEQRWTQVCSHGQDCGEEVEDDRSRAVFSRRWESTGKTRGCCLLLTLASCAPSVTWTCSASACICFLPKRLGMLHLFVPLQMHAWSRTWLQNCVLKLHRAFPMACAILRYANFKKSRNKGVIICTVCVCGARVGPPWRICLIIVQVLYMHSIVYDH